MHHNRESLTNGEFDLLIIGGGIFGACIAWNASLRGYSVAVIDKGDFGAATSANHYKFIHGGIRYLQHLDLYRLRESSSEKSALIRMAPHLAYPLPIVLPTYGHGRRGKEIMAAAMLAYDALTLDRNRGISDAARRTPRGTVMTRDQVLSKFPNLQREGLTGAAVFHDGQIYNPPRLVLAFIQSACANGAIAANYVEATDILLEAGRAYGCAARDLTTGKKLEIRGKVLINAAGPWAKYLLKSFPQYRLEPEPSFSRDLAFVVKKSVSKTHALGCPAATQDSDAILDRGARHLFLVPWRGMTLVGVWHRYTSADPDRIEVSHAELEGFLREINSSYPGLDLSLSDIGIINTGHILFGSEEAQGTRREHSFAKRSVIFDHTSQGLEGLISVVGVRATISRGVSDQVLRLVGKKLGDRKGSVNTRFAKIHGGDFSTFDQLTSEISGRLPTGGPGLAEAVAHNYGSSFANVFECAARPEDLEPVGRANVLKAEIVHAIRHEMAMSLEDIVMRRTELGTGGHPGSPALEAAAKTAAMEFGWDDVEQARQLSGLDRILSAKGPWEYVDALDSSEALKT